MTPSKLLLTDMIKICLIKRLNISINVRVPTFGGMGGGLAKQGLTENCVPRSGPEDIFTE